MMERMIMATKAANISSLFISTKPISVPHSRPPDLHFGGSCFKFQGVKLKAVITDYFDC